MAAKDHVSPQQMRLFMSGTELMNEVRPLDYSWDKPETTKRLWSRKLKASKVPHSESGRHGSGVYQSLSKEGVFWGEDPIQIEFRSVDGETLPHLADGHHRVAAAADIEKKTGKPLYFPVEYVPSWDFD